MPRPVKLEECNRCHEAILTGVDDYRLDIRANLIPLTRDGEIHAMVAGLDCWRIDGDRRAWRTDQWRIRTDCPLPGDHRVAAHVCGVPPPDEWLAPPPPPAPRPTAQTTKENPNGEPRNDRPLRRLRGVRGA